MKNLINDDLEPSSSDDETENESGNESYKEYDNEYDNEQLILMNLKIKTVF